MVGIAVYFVRMVKFFNAQLSIDFTCDIVGCILTGVRDVRPLASPFQESDCLFICCWFSGSCVQIQKWLWRFGMQENSFPACLLIYSDP